MTRVRSASRATVGTREAVRADQHDGLARDRHPPRRGSTARRRRRRAREPACGGRRHGALPRRARTAPRQPRRRTAPGPGRRSRCRRAARDRRRSKGERPWAVRAEGREGHAGKTTGPSAQGRDPSHQGCEAQLLATRSRNRLTRALSPRPGRSRAQVAGRSPSVVLCYPARERLGCRGGPFVVLLATFASVLLLAACAHVREPSAPTAAAGPSVAETTAELRRLGSPFARLAPDVFVAVVDSPNQSAANVLFVKARDGSVVICSSPTTPRRRAPSSAGSRRSIRRGSRD